MGPSQSFTRVISNAGGYIKILKACEYEDRLYLSLVRRDWTYHVLAMRLYDSADGQGRKEFKIVGKVEVKEEPKTF